MAAFEPSWAMSESSSSQNNNIPASSTVSSISSDLSPPKSASATSATAVDSSPTYASFTPSPSVLPQLTSPLLSSTPPTVTKALSQAYPFILAADHVLGLLTWTSNDVWKSFLLVAGWTGIVLYYEILVRYFGHLLVVGTIAGYVWFNEQVEKEQQEHPTLDAIVHTLTNATTRLNLFLQPITSLSLTIHDVKRLLFTTLFLTPVYMIIAFLVVTPRTLLYIGGVFILTYHSVWARVTRAILWRSRTVRLISFYLTGLDFSGYRVKNFSQAQLAKFQQTDSSTNNNTGVNKPVRFTYVLYENQRRWLGIGWTSNLLAYERTAWTDEFLNDSTNPDNFKLPDASDQGMVWRWVDKTWRLDLTNDGSLTLKSSKQSSTPDPGPNDGFIYYDNTWKKPSAEDSFSKYTRRRRWIRTAELITAGQDSNSDFFNKSEELKESSVKKRKGLRFED